MPPRQADDALLREMMAIATGEAGARRLHRDDARGSDRDSLAVAQPEMAPASRPCRAENAEVVIIGAGMSGLYAGIQLREAGIPFVILEKNDAVGGTWYENIYPGCGVDTPNHFYSYAFEPNHDWSHFFAKRDELWNYFEKVADKYDLRKHIRLGTEVVDARYDESDAIWRVTAQGADGTRQELFGPRAGVRGRRAQPAEAARHRGAATPFAGPAFHTAQWDRDFDWRGKRVAMIGTGASGHQVGPSIAPDVARLMIFQRSPHWVVPNPNYHEGVSEGKKWALANIPFYLRWYRFQLFWGFADGLHAALKVDPDWPHPKRSLNALNEKHRRFMEKHMRSELADRPDLLDKGHSGLSGLRQAHPDRQSLVQDAQARQCRSRHRPDRRHRARGRADKRRQGLARGRAGVRHRLQGQQDAAPDEDRGQDGRELHEVWGPDDARAYLGLTVPGFPNFFMLTGPNTGLAHGGNQIFMTECGVRHMMLGLRELLEGGHRSIECRRDVYERYNREVDAMHARMVWTHKGMTNWYRNPHGRVFAITPWRLVEYWKMTSVFDAAEYEFG